MFPGKSEIAGEALSRLKANIRCQSRTWKDPSLHLRDGEVTKKGGKEEAVYC
jgi:hypothetical protein